MLKGLVLGSYSLAVEGSGLVLGSYSLAVEGSGLGLTGRGLGSWVL